MIQHFQSTLWTVAANSNCKLKSDKKQTSWSDPVSQVKTNLTFISSVNDANCECENSG
jgi:hypothetical protein